MTETAKERFYREELESIKLDLLEARPVSPSNIAKALIEADELPVTTDKLSVEKLQEYLLPYKKEMVQKIRDEKMQLVTADEFVKLHKESLTAIRENDKLQEQLNTAKKYIEHVIGTIKHDGHLGTIQTDLILPDLEKALAAIGGDDE
ncbi:hypothetical protein P7H90_08440 [Lactococcus lactis]|uniref:hypothetical protein n=2 Tax=Lactococcus lactis TaxID=1358 RepID=UPI002891D985|nr:hypothetical protein [Lactococcus lactis]MDT2869981.1 hypothetical protein [Lactococcus lactis]MDT2919309.1 hypothetical protein [Lactococcus lactis]